MVKIPANAGSHSPAHDARATPLTGVVIGIAISLLLWAMIFAIVFTVR